MPMRRRMRRSSVLPSLTISTSLSAIEPDVGSTRRLTQRITVDLPAPDGPISAITCPSGTSISTLFSARSPVRQRLVRPLMRSMKVSWLRVLLAGVFYTAGCVDFTNDTPILFVGDRDELILAFELGLQCRAFPRKGEKRVLDLRLQCRIEIVGNPVARRRECFGFVDRPDLVLVHDIALEHAEHDFVGDC